ncbi:hypothetical protein CC78DRAFT_540969 [Lojkania enalia]|uniref:Uncharacterized protein n=1 Tax=Lojkania enalia TaxID=147567 RepID=A0A9P4KHF4_9PLEO|nr:hypothetical protein CC78DRAFT_540969 [Didymosphaeria enalia]
MQLLNLLLAIAGIASAADIFRTTGDNCSGTKIGCSGIQENNCCAFSIARPQLSYNLPANSRGQGWSGAGCTGNVGTFTNVNQVTNRCVSFSIAVSSAKWLTGLNKREELSDEPCAEPNVAIYEIDGEEKKVRIPEGKSFEIEQWIEDGEWAKLSRLQAYSV